MITLNQSMDADMICYTDTDSFIINIITEDFFEDIFNVVEVWYDTSNYDENDKRPLPVGKNKNVIGLFKDELGGRRKNYQRFLHTQSKNIFIFNG